MPRVNHMAEDLVGSQILELAEQIRQKLREGEQIYNLTIGDFDPEIFPIPDELTQLIAQAYQSHQTNYPSSNGMPELREAIQVYIETLQGLQYDANDFLVSSGARPLIYACYQTLVNPGEKVIYPTPSWNNNFYSHIAGADAIEVITHAEDNFMPTADLIRPHLADTALVALCSPLNPTGTVFRREQLYEICELILEENTRRGPDKKPVYLMYDQIYWNLTYGDTRHYDPVNLMPELRPFTIYIDGLSKAFAATGLRMGWAFGPSDVIHKMKLLLAHIGSWSSKPAQMGTAAYLKDPSATERYLGEIRQRLSLRLEKFYQGFQTMKQNGLPVDAISPQAALYLTVRFNLGESLTPDGQKLDTGKKVYHYLLNEAGVALVPFYAFGLPEDSPWFRLSVGTTREDDIEDIILRLTSALKKLK